MPFMAKIWTPKRSKKVLADILINVFVARGHVFGRFLRTFLCPKTLPFWYSFCDFLGTKPDFRKSGKIGGAKNDDF